MVVNGHDALGSTNDHVRTDIAHLVVGNRAVLVLKMSRALIYLLIIVDGFRKPGVSTFSFAYRKRCMWGTSVGQNGNLKADAWQPGADRHGGKGENCGWMWGRCCADSAKVGQWWASVGMCCAQVCPGGCCPCCCCCCRCSPPPKKCIKNWSWDILRIFYISYRSSTTTQKSRKPAMLARNMPGAGPANFFKLSMLIPSWRLVTLRSWVQPPLRPSSQKQWYLQCFLHYRAVKPR